MNSWQLCKAWLGTTTGLPDSTLHAVTGTLLLVVAAALFRRSLWHWRPWLAVLVLELLNETYDMLNPASGEDRLAASFHDLWLTMLIPTVLLLFGGWIAARARH
ncbi:hypothetical protein AB2M62_05425 [Sphingomonas sp. MMS12-HWE2-04]|uniref:hypothetical protein n=1 Tax=Sphingomonas sp. MMS12-HWE2-04 TaxID=3234199 RepID=UPI003850B9A4